MKIKNVDHIDGWINQPVRTKPHGKYMFRLFDFLAVWFCVSLGCYVLRDAFAAEYQTLKCFLSYSLPYAVGLYFGIQWFFRWVF